MSKINKDATINQIIRDHPKTMAVLNRYGLDICCGGAHTLAEACKFKKIDLAALLKELSKIS